MTTPQITAAQATPPPAWALAQRHLIEAMNQAAPVFQERYTRADGTYIWRDAWPGMDGSDDGYESYHNWPLLYALGGGAELHRRSRFLWDAVTRQFTAYGQIWREFDAYYDWMHHGESSLLLYYFGLAVPTVAIDRARALRFARMYTGDARRSPAARGHAWRTAGTIGRPTAPSWRPTRRRSRTSPASAGRSPTGTTTRSTPRSCAC